MKRILTAILLATSALAQTQEVNLVARWSFDEGRGMNVVDSSGNGFNGVLEGKPLPGWTNGVAGFGLMFDGVQNGLTVVSTQESGVSNLASVFGPSSSVFSQLTVSAWVKAAVGTTGEIVAKWSTNGLAQGSFMLSLTNGVPCFELRVNGAHRSVLGGFGRTDGQWHFVAGSYDGKQMAVYWDWTLAGSCAASGMVEAVDAPVQIGLLNAVVDEVSLHNRALSATDLFALYQADRNADGVPDCWAANNVWAGSSTGGVTVVPDLSDLIATQKQSGGVSVTAPVEKLGRIWYVNALTGNNTLTGQSAVQAKKEIGAALQVAGSGDVIEIAAGDYREFRLTGSSGTVFIRPQGTVRVGNPGVKPIPERSDLALKRAKETEPLQALYAEVMRQRALMVVPVVPGSSLTNNFTNSVTNSLTNTVGSSVLP